MYNFGREDGHEHGRFGGGHGTASSSDPGWSARLKHLLDRNSRNLNRNVLPGLGPKFTAPCEVVSRGEGMNCHGQTDVKYTAGQLDP